MSSQVSNSLRGDASTGGNASLRQGVNARQAETIERLLAAGDEELRAVGHEVLTIRTVASRAGVSPATAYTYLASRNHLFAELFSRALQAHPAPAPTGADRVARVQAVTRHLARLLSDSPELAAAATLALLGSDPEVERLRLRIGADFVRRFELALGEGSDPALVETLTLAFTGALLQAGIGLMTYAGMSDQLDAAIAVIMEGHA